MVSVAPMCARRNASRNETAVEAQLRKKATFFSTKVKTAVRHLRLRDVAFSGRSHLMRLLDGLHKSHVIPSMAADSAAFSRRMKGAI